MSQGTQYKRQILYYTHIDWIKTFRFETELGLILMCLPGLWERGTYTFLTHTTFLPSPFSEIYFPFTPWLETLLM